MKKKIQSQELLILLEYALKYKDKRKQYIRQFEELVGEYEIDGMNEEQIVALEDLAYDCAFYSDDFDARIEDPALLDDEELERRIRETLRRIKSSGQ